MSGMNSWLASPQPRLGAVGLLVLLVMGSLAAPLSLDMYTPAIPTMADYFDTTADIVNLTLMGYTLFMAIGLLVFGPLSDKYGRKPVLVGGMGAYCLASIACALSVNIWMLIVARLVQALGSGAMSSVCTAIVKDAISPKYREKMFAIVQIMFVIGPVAAPIIGAGVLQFTNWRGTFWVLTGISAVEVALALLYKETLPKEHRLDVGIIATMGRLVHVGRDRAFMLFLLVSAAWELGYMGYVSVGSYIYIDYFGFSPVGYSLFFAVASIACALGPAAWLRLSRRMTARRFTTIAIFGSILIGIATMTVGHLNAFLFCGLFLVFAFFESAVRPFAANILLSQSDDDTGSAASLFNFMRAFIGVVGMTVVVFPCFSDYLVAVGVMMAGGLILALACWIALLKSSSVLHGIKNLEQHESLM